MLGEVLLYSKLKNFSKQSENCVDLKKELSRSILLIENTEQIIEA